MIGKQKQVNPPSSVATVCKEKGGGRIGRRTTACLVNLNLEKEMKMGSELPYAQ